MNGYETRPFETRANDAYEMTRKLQRMAESERDPATRKALTKLATQAQGMIATSADHAAFKILDLVKQARKLTRNRPRDGVVLRLDEEELR